MGNGPLNSLAQLEIWRLELRFLTTVGAVLAVGLIFVLSALGMNTAVGFGLVLGILAVAFVGCVITAISLAFGAGGVAATDRALDSIAKFNAEYDQRFRPEV